MDQYKEYKKKWVIVSCNFLAHLKNTYLDDSIMNRAYDAGRFLYIEDDDGDIVGFLVYGETFNIYYTVGLNKEIESQLLQSIHFTKIGGR